MKNISWENSYIFIKNISYKIYENYVTWIWILKTLKKCNDKKFALTLIQTHISITRNEYWSGILFAFRTQFPRTIKISSWSLSRRASRSRQETGAEAGGGLSDFTRSEDIRFRHGNGQDKPETLGKLKA